MVSATQPQFRQIIDSARERRGDGGTDTMTVNGHLAQMRLFMLRQGIEFYPRQDTFGFRKTFLENLVEDNEIDARLDGIVDDFCIDGKGLWFFRPTKESYRILWFPKDDYRAYYDTQGEIEEADLVYSYRVREAGVGFGTPAPGGGSEKWVRLQVRRDLIRETISDDRPSLDPDMPAMYQGGGRSRVVRNSLGFVPAVEAFNNMRSTGMDATGDFDWLAGHIVTHDELVRNIRKNINFFGNPTLISSRGKQDIVEGGDDGMGPRPTIASQAGFRGVTRPSTRVSVPTGTGGSGSGFKVARLIANLEPTDRVGYITPDAVSGDQNVYARQYREELRTALGGVDELGISSGATAYEIRSLYGRAATTASRKCRGLLTYGLCKLLALVILNEERVFRESFAAALNMKKPEAPLQEEIPDQKKFDKAIAEFKAAKQKYDDRLEARIRDAVQKQELPLGVIGLIPDGDRRVQWRWRGPVFEDSTEEVLQRSIVVRNLQELGVNSIQALYHLFPDKTDEERSAMLSGYPFRMAQATQQSIGTFLQLIAQMRQTPHPQAPDLPLLADSRLDLTFYLYRALDFLKRELTYAGNYRDTTGSGDPAALDAVERSRHERGLPASVGTRLPTFVPDAWNGGDAFDAATGGRTAGLLPFGTNQSMAGGPAGASRQYERDAQLPAPGGLLAFDPLGSPFGGASTGLPGAGQLPGGTFRFGAPDLSVPLSGGLPISDVFGAGGGSGSGGGSGKRSVQRRQRPKP
ncbi:MAG: hypothetical protein VKI63_06150 [Cyanobium sp.]|nr:hypothetical protein [Cyanobium sp.]